MSRRARLLLPLLIAMSVGACAAPPRGDRPPAAAKPAAPATTATTAPAREAARPSGQASPPTTAGWPLGARPLPLRPDGYGKVLPTPPQLRRRALATVDRLPPPRDGRFSSAIAPVSPAIRGRMGTSWSPRCPVGLADLRYLTVSFHGFDGKAHTGELVVHQRVARQVVGVFARLYRARFPIEEMRLVTTADLDAHPTGDGNNTAAFVCRAARQQTRWSAHAYGLAVDVNPFQNPFHRRDLVLPERASAYLDRGWARPGMIRPGDVVTKAFAAVGWAWGGDWRSPTDPMHFSATGG
jgi:D-alanyl-D-alanine carboxypeptidase